jgi:hypothetical protein
VNAQGHVLVRVVFVGVEAVHALLDDSVGQLVEVQTARLRDRVRVDRRGVQALSDLSNQRVRPEEARQFGF